MGRDRTMSMVEYEPGDDDAPIGETLVTSANHLAAGPALCAYVVMTVSRKGGSGKCLGSFDCPESMKPQVFRALAKMLKEHSADLYRVANKAERKR